MSHESELKDSRSLLGYYSRIEELHNYRVTELTHTIVNIFRDYILNYINKESDIIKLKGAKVGWENDLFQHQIEINDVFKKLKIVEEIKFNLFDIIYYGQYCIKIQWDKENKKFIKNDLQNPYNVVSVIKGGKIDYHLVSREDKILKEKPNAIIRFGKADIHLINDITTQDKNEDFVVGMPLYYNITKSVKDYLLKESIASLLSSEDLINPLLLLVKFDKSNPLEESSLKEKVRILIDKYSDNISSLMTEVFIDDFIDALIENIRTLPDYSSAAGDMNSTDLSKITNKIAEIRNSMDMNKDSILTTLAIPRALFNGEITKWEALKGSDRLHSKVNNYISNINDSLIHTAAMFYYIITGKEIDIEGIECNLFSNDIKEMEN
jgi:hypothetical protein